MIEKEINSIPTKTVEEKLASVISYFFHPLLMPTYGFLLIFFTKNYISTFVPPKLKFIIIIITFIFTCILPTINTLILLKMKRIKNLEMETANERIFPYAATAFYFFALFYLFYNAQFPNVFNILILGAAISILLTLIINYKWKISAHMVGIGGIVGGILGITYRLMIDLRLIIMLMILLSGIVAYARLKLKAHDPSQIYTGFVLGFFVELVLMIFY